MYKNRLFSHSGDDLLRFAQDRAYLYEPHVDWRDAAAYPSITTKEAALDVKYGRRLAWEFIRRTPRYRHAFRHLIDNGLLESRQFPTGQRFFSHEYPAGPPSGGFNASLHACSHRAEPDETVAQFAKRHKGATWWIQHAHDWACQHWCMMQLCDPALTYNELTNTPHFDRFPKVLGGERAEYEPTLIELTPGAHTVVAVLRLDASISSQLARLKPRLERDHETYKASQGVKGANLKFREFAHYWLRTWDAWQAFRVRGKEPDLEEILIVFEHEADKQAVSFEGAGWPDRRAVSQSDLIRRYFEDGKESLQNWMQLMESHMLDRDSAFRSLLFENPVLSSRTTPGSEEDPPSDI
jgi:hypothetical protein